MKRNPKLQVCKVLKEDLVAVFDRSAIADETVYEDLEGRKTDPVAQLQYQQFMESEAKPFFNWEKATQAFLIAIRKIGLKNEKDKRGFDAISDKLKQEAVRDVYRGYLKKQIECLNKARFVTSSDPKQAPAHQMRGKQEDDKNKNPKPNAKDDKPCAHTGNSSNLLNCAGTTPSAALQPGHSDSRDDNITRLQTVNPYCIPELNALSVDSYLWGRANGLSEVDIAFCFPAFLDFGIPIIVGFIIF